MTRDQLLQDMQACFQTESQSVYDHGLSVWEHVSQLLDFLQGSPLSEEWQVPSWLLEHRSALLKSLLPFNLIKEYAVFHDCGKPYCQPEGDRKFPNHAEVSYHTWLAVGGNKVAAELMRLDMVIHTLKAKDIEAFVTLPEAPTLLLVGLAEVHANAAMFGGKRSDSFKMKWKQLDRRGRAICRTLFATPSRTDKLYLITRGDLSEGSQAVQSIHAAHEFGDLFPDEFRDWRATSNTVALLSIENENKLQALLEQAKKRGFPVAPFYEPDLGNALTAIAIGPSGKKLCRSLQLALSSHV